ncbi:MAG: hypothetical protein AAF519_09930 [Bacteroidota bacterium]
MQKVLLQIMYNLSFDERTTCANRYNIRLGFEIDFKKRVIMKEMIDGRKLRKRNACSMLLKRNREHKIAKL